MGKDESQQENLPLRIRSLPDVPSNTNDAIEWQAVCERMEAGNPLAIENDEATREWRDRKQKLIWASLDPFKSNLKHVFIQATSQVSQDVHRPLIYMSLWICAKWLVDPPNWLHKPVCDFIWIDFIQEMSETKKPNTGGRHSNAKILVEDKVMQLKAFAIDSVLQTMPVSGSRRALAAMFLNLDEKTLEKQLEQAVALLRNTQHDTTPTLSFALMVALRVPLKELSEFLSTKH